MRVLAIMRSQTVRATLGVQTCYTLKTGGDYQAKPIDHVKFKKHPSPDDVLPYLTCFQDFSLELPEGNVPIKRVLTQAPSPVFLQYERNPSNVANKLSRGDIEFAPVPADDSDQNVYYRICDAIRMHLDTLRSRGKTVQLYKHECIDIDHGEQRVRVRVNTSHRAESFFLPTLVAAHSLEEIAH